MHDSDYYFLLLYLDFRVARTSHAEKVAAVVLAIPEAHSCLTILEQGQPSPLGARSTL